MSTGHEIAMALRAAYLAMHRRSDATFARYGVTADQFVILAALRGGCAVAQRNLARRTVSDPNTVRAMLLLLEKRGFVARTPDPSDGRVLSVALTPTGRKVYAALWKAGKPVRTRLLGSLGPGESQTLLDLVSRSMAPPDDRNSHSQDPSRTRS